jgi:hypothetical protein
MNWSLQAKLTGIAAIFAVLTGFVAALPNTTQVA